MVFALDDAQPDHGIVDPAERLVIPPVGAGLDQGREIHQLEGTELDVDMRRIRVGLFLAHEGSVAPARPGVKNPGPPTRGVSMFVRRLLNRSRYLGNTW